MIEDIQPIFPLHLDWPDAIDDVRAVPGKTTVMRLKIGAKNLSSLSDSADLKRLWCFNGDETSINAICHCKSLVSLFLENIKTDDLSCIRNLANLKVLSMDTCSKISSLNGLMKLQMNLSGLALTNFKNVHSLEPLHTMTSLKALVVDGSMWTRMKIKTLEPVGRLTNLELLQLHNCKVEDQSLRPLAALKNLKQLNIANFYPMEEFARLSQQLKTTKCIWFEPYVEMPGIECKKCKRANMLMLTGKGKRMVCSKCDEKRLGRHLREWNDAIERS